MAARPKKVKAAGEEHTLSIQAWERAGSDHPGRLEVQVDGHSLRCTYQVLDRERLRIQHGDRSFTFHLAVDRGEVHASALGCHVRIEPIRTRRGGQDGTPPPEVTPPMPAVVVEVLVAPGDIVERGQPVVVVSAMKMESTLVAPRDGVVGQVRATAGDKVSPGDVLVTVNPVTREESDG